MDLDRNINYIIEGASVQEQIDTMILSEGIFEKYKRKLVALGIATVIAGTALYIYRRSGSCETKLQRFIAWVMGEVWNHATKHGVNAAAGLAGKVAAETLGPKAGIAVSMVVRRGLNKLKRQIEKDHKPTPKELLRAAQEALAELMPAKDDGAAHLAKSKETITSNGYKGWGIKIHPGPTAWKEWLELRYNEGMEQELPLCILILMYSSDAAASGTSTYEQFSGVGEAVIRKEFKEVLKKEYPNFEI